MTRQKQTQISPSRSWKWPIDLNRYDRTPSLSSSEEATLERLIHHSETGKVRWLHDPHPELHRLLLPLHDVLVLTGAKPNVSCEVIRILLWETHRHHTSFWAWTPDDWITLLHPDGNAFPIHYLLSHSARQYLVVTGYLLHCYQDFYCADRVGRCSMAPLAIKVFGQELVEAAVQRVQHELHLWGYGVRRLTGDVSRVLCAALLLNESPYLEDLSSEILDALRQKGISRYDKHVIYRISRALAHMGIIDKPLPPVAGPPRNDDLPNALTDVPAVWLQWVQRWRDTTTLAPKTRTNFYYDLLKVGRWLSGTHPEVTDPGQWTRELAAEYVAAVDRMKVGEWGDVGNRYQDKVGKPITAVTKAHHFGAMRIFFQDCQEWGWIPRKFDVRRSFGTPRPIRALIGPDPRVIADDIWAKLLWAGLNLTVDDLSVSVSLPGPAKGKREPAYPLEMVRAMGLVWLFAGLRLSEFRRLRVGCIRWQREDVRVQGTDEVLAKDTVCWLDVPSHKTGTAFTKAVDRAVGEAITAWEQVRPTQPAVVDPKTGEVVHYLFSYRGTQIGYLYLNERLIPLLCRKAGVPTADARGGITSHRARSTIASQLYNAKEPLSLFDLQEWLGHRMLASTQYYAKKSPTQVAKAYEKAGYFERNIRTVKVLIDQDVIKSGGAVNGVPWKFYDLGHGYCTYDFFEQCPHRMACAKCSFYQPKGSTQAQLLEGKTNLQHMLQEIPLSEEERAAVEDGISAMERLCLQLTDVPTPAGPTPKQLAARNQEKETIIPMERVRRKRQSK